MSVFSITLIVAVILFVREEVLSSLYRKELQRANEEYEAYRRALRCESLSSEGLLQSGSEGDAYALGEGERSEGKSEWFYPAA